MIAKNIKAKSFAGCVKYVIKKDAEVLLSEGVMDLNAKTMITSFELQQSVRPEIKSPVGHIPISFSPEDKERMTNDFMVKIAKEYMQFMGIKDTQYIIVRHHDNPNEHIHIVYNRIDNNGKLISDKNDYRRNITSCKVLKDKYNLTYGENKFKVKREKLQGSERIRHDIYHAVREEIVWCRKVEELQARLKSRGVVMEYKYRRGTNEPQGISFTKDNCTFKGSQIDRNFSYRGVQLMFQYMEKEWAKIDEKQAQQAKPKHDFKYDIPEKIVDVALTDEQRISLDKGESVCFKDRINSAGDVFDVYVQWSEQEKKLNFYYEDPCAFSTLGVLDLPNGGCDDPEEEEFRRAMQRKKKKRGMRM